MNEKKTDAEKREGRGIGEKQRERKEANTWMVLKAKCLGDL